MPLTPSEHFTGLLLGTAVGDALGLPREGLSAARAARCFGAGPLRHRLLLGRGMISDDTEHAALTAGALVRAGGDEQRFGRLLARGLRGWFLALPPALGWTTLRACLRLCLGFPASHSGVRSQGNGPAMRAPVLGAALAHDPERLARFVRVATRVTHDDPIAEAGALAIALAARHAVLPGRLDAAAFLDVARAACPALAVHLDDVGRCLATGRDAPALTALASSPGFVSGWIVHTVPAALLTWLRHPDDFSAAVEEMIALGGDTDSTAAIVGALAGARLGPAAIPPAWLDGITDWPRGVPHLRRVAASLASGSPVPRVFFPGALARNLVFLAVALGHGLRRLAPPY